MKKQYLVPAIALIGVNDEDILTQSPVGGGPIDDGEWDIKKNVVNLGL